MIYKVIDSMLKDLGLKTKGDGRGPHRSINFCSSSFFQYVMNV